jgi:hypothetical protein
VYTPARIALPIRDVYVLQQYEPKSVALLFTSHHITPIFVYLFVFPVLEWQETAYTDALSRS